jgi:hypothetical protein
MNQNKMVNFADRGWPVITCYAALSLSEEAVPQLAMVVSSVQQEWLIKRWSTGKL